MGDIEHWTLEHFTVGTPAFLADFGAAVRRVREGRGMSMDDLAAITGMSKASISTIENGFTDPRLSTVFRLAEGLRLPWWSLLGHACRYPGASDQERQP